MKNKQRMFHKKSYLIITMILVLVFGGFTSNLSGVIFAKEEDALQLGTTDNHREITRPAKLYSDRLTTVIIPKETNTYRSKDTQSFTFVVENKTEQELSGLTLIANGDELNLTKVAFYDMEGKLIETEMDQTNSILRNVTIPAKSKVLYELQGVIAEEEKIDSYWMSSSVLDQDGIVVTVDTIDYSTNFIAIDNISFAQDKENALTTLASITYQNKSNVSISDLTTYIEGVNTTIKEQKTHESVSLEAGTEAIVLSSFLTNQEKAETSSYLKVIGTGSLEGKKFSTTRVITIDHSQDQPQTEEIKPSINVAPLSNEMGALHDEFDMLSSGIEFVVTPNTVFDMTVTANPNKAYYKPGETITLTTTLYNKSNKDVDSKNISVNASFDHNVMNKENQNAFNQLKTNLPNKIGRSTTVTSTITITIPQDMEEGYFNTTLYMQYANIDGNGNIKENYAEGTVKFAILNTSNLIITSGTLLNNPVSVGTRANLAFEVGNYTASDSSFTYQISVKGGESKGLEITPDSIIWNESFNQNLKSKETTKGTLSFPTSTSANGMLYKVTVEVTDKNGLKSSKTVDVPVGDLKNNSDLINNGINFNKISKWYYGNVARDSVFQKNELYFNDANSFWNQLVYINGVKGTKEAVAFFEQWQYDLHPANTIGVLGDYEDRNLSYPKDALTPFHVTPNVNIQRVEGTMQDGVILGGDIQCFEELTKTVSPDEGDANTQREYEIDLLAKEHAKQTKPVVLLFQIQTSWQMFDLAHATGAAASENTTDILSLYEMKQAFLEFNEWLSKNSNGSVMIGITNFQHNNSSLMFKYPYFTNDYDTIKTGLYGWDTYGDCEHIHYPDAATSALTTAGKALSEYPFIEWQTDNNIALKNEAEMFSVIVGGACEEADLSYKSEAVTRLITPGSSSFQKVTRQFGISTNAGTTDHLSWMDYANDVGKFDTGEYYKGKVTREDFLSSLKSIYEHAQSEGYLNDVVIEDTVTDEFDVTEVKAYIETAKGKQEVTNQSKLTVVKQQDGTTSVSYNFGKVKNFNTVHLKIKIKAKEDYIGSNNVKTNSDKEGQKPNISYSGRLEPDKTFTQQFEQIPTANVPIQVEIKDGKQVTVNVNKDVNLKNLAMNNSQSITKEFEESLGKYDQINGTVKYQWKDANGNVLKEGIEVEVKDGKIIGNLEIPSYIVNSGTETNKQYQYYLEAIFVPNEVSSDSTSQVAVSSKTDIGKVGINVEEIKTGTLKIKKIITNESEQLNNDEFPVLIESEAFCSGIVLKHNEVSTSIIVDEETKFKISEILPKEYALVGYAIEGGTNEINSQGEVTVSLGDDITVIISNTYEPVGFFQSIASVMNQFTKAIKNK